MAKTLKLVVCGSPGGAEIGVSRGKSSSERGEKQTLTGRNAIAAAFLKHIPPLKSLSYTNIVHVNMFMLIY